MQKNVTGQKFRVFAFDATTNLPKTGDAANITAYVSKDFGAVTVLGDTSATEEDATNAKGYYLFDATQAESNADNINVSAKSSTANIVVIGVPATIFTTPPNYTKLAVDATAGGVLLSDGVAHAGTPGSSTATLALKQLNATNSAGDAVVASSTGSNGNGINASGNGTGGGVRGAGGATGDGLDLVGGATSGDGFKVTTTSGHGFNITATGTAKDAVHLVGAAASGANAGGHGLNLVGGAASTTGGGTAGGGFKATGGAGAASTNGAGEGFTVAGGGTTTVSGANGASFTGTGNLNGVSFAGAGTGAGAIETGGATGPGHKTVGGGTSGDGWLITTTSGHGINANPTGGDGVHTTGSGATNCGVRATGASAVGGAASGEGIYGLGGSATTTGGGTAGRGIVSQGGSGAASTNAAGEGFLTLAGTNGGAGGADGIKSTPTGAGFGLNATINGNITGNLSGSVGSVTGAVGSVTGSVGSVTGAVGSVTGSVGGNVVGSVGSVTGAVGSVTGNVGGNVTGNVTGTAGGFTAAGWAGAFTVNTTKLYADAITGSFVKETASGVSITGGPSLFDGVIIKPQRTATVTITIASPGVVTWAAHGFIADEPVKFTTTGALPTGLSPGTTYYVSPRGLAAGSFRVMTAAGSGSDVNTSGTQSGTHTGTGGNTVNARQAFAGFFAGMGYTSGTRTTHVTAVMPAVGTATSNSVLVGWDYTNSLTGDHAAATFTPPV